MQITLDLPISYNIGDHLYFLDNEREIRVLLIKEILLDGIFISPKESSVESIAFLCMDDIGLEFAYTNKDLEALKVTKTKEELLSQIESKIWLKK